MLISIVLAGGIQKILASWNILAVQFHSNEYSILWIIKCKSVHRRSIQWISETLFTSQKYGMKNKHFKFIHFLFHLIYYSEFHSMFRFRYHRRSFKQFELDLLISCLHALFTPKTPVFCIIWKWFIWNRFSFSYVFSQYVFLFVTFVMRTWNKAREFTKTVDWKE